MAGIGGSQGEGFAQTEVSHGVVAVVFVRRGIHDEHPAQRLHLIRADIDDAIPPGKRCAALVVGEAGGGGVVARIDRRTVAEQGHRHRRPAIARERADQWIDRRGERAHLIAVRAIGKARGAAERADEIVSRGGEGTTQV